MSEKIYTLYRFGKALVTGTTKEVDAYFYEHFPMLSTWNLDKQGFTLLPEDLASKG